MEVAGTDKLIGLSTSQAEVKLTETEGATTHQMMTACGPASHLRDLKAIP